MKETRNSYKTLTTDSVRKSSHTRTRHILSITLNWMINKLGVACIQVEWRVVNTAENVWGSVICGQCLDHVRNYQRLQKDSAS
jgi:hypothetical protein